jgi:predicted ATP-dependent endonuclease of OLD family
MFLTNEDYITIHNFRSILDGQFNLDNYTLLVGENNSGKTTIVTAIRIFYEDGGIKFNESRDFPKIETNDNEIIVIKPSPLPLLPKTCCSIGAELIINTIKLCRKSIRFRKAKNFSNLFLNITCQFK